MILITGGTGAMGSVLAHRLIAAGHRIRVFALAGDRGIARLRGMGAQVCEGNIAQAKDVFGLCDGVDTVLHLAAVIITPNEKMYDVINRQGTENIVAEARRCSVRHFIHVSSASVVYPKPTPYSLSKQKAEEVVKNCGLNFTIVRPTLVYGEKGGLEFDMFLAYLRAFPVVPFIGSGKALKRPVYVNDIVDGLEACVGNEKAFGKTYGLSGAETVSMNDFSRLCLSCMGMEKKILVPMPVFLCRCAAWVMRVTMKNPPLRWPVIAGITQDADLDPASAIADLGYHPYGVGEKLRECFPRT